MLEIRNVTKKYKPKRGTPVLALDNFSLKLQEKGMVFILGKSGSGKSTLLNVLGGLDRYDSGEIIIKGKSSKAFKQRDFDSYRNTYIGFIFQEYNILDEFTVGANIALAMELQGKKATNEAINEIMDEVDLTGYGSRKPNELSGGQKQRVAIARALVKNPEIIMADEPTGALDSKTGIQVFDTLKKLSKDKLVLVVSHDREFAELYGDRVIELADGKIISDIEKHKTQSKSQSDGVSLVDDSLIYIKKGYRLTSNDLDLINKYLEKSDEDVFISTDGTTNNQIKKFAKIDDDGNREVFKPTNNSEIETNNFSNTFKLIRSRLPYKDSFKIGASGLKSKPIRLFFTIVLSMVAFTLFGLADTMGSYNKVTSTVTSIIDSNVTNISFEKREKNSYNKTNMSDEDVAILEDKLGIDFKPVYIGESQYSQIDLYRNFNDGNKLTRFNQNSLSGFSEFTNEEIIDLEFTITGNMPTKFDEIAISSYFYEQFKVAGYRDIDGSEELEPEDINSESDIIGKKVFINNESYKITAIIDTNLDTSRYESLKDENVNRDINSYIKEDELRTVINYGYHGIVFVKPGFIENKKANSAIGINIDSIGDVYIDNNDNSYGYRVNYLAKLSDINSSNIYMLDKTKETISDGEVLLNAWSIFENLNYSVYENIEVLPEDIPEEYDNITFQDYLDLTIENAIYHYAEDNYLEAYANGFTANLAGYYYEEDTATESDKIEAYSEYLRYYVGSYNNIFGDKNGYEIEMDAKKPLIIKYDILSFNSDTYKLFSQLYSSYNEENDFRPIDVVGYFFPESYSEYDNMSYLVVDDNFYSTFEESISGLYSMAIGKMPSNKSDITKIVEFSYDDGIDDTNYIIQNEVSYLLNQVNDFIEDSAKVFLYIGIGFAVFSSLLLFNFITTSISYKKREIGILRALGARSSDVFGIFFNESLIIALINFVLAFIVTLGAIIYLNSYLRNEYGLLITILNFGIRQVVLMLFVAVAVALIASFLPVYKIAHKKPIDAINNR